EGFSISGDSVGEYSASDAKQKYEFSVNESGRTTWEVNCATTADWSQVETEGFLGGKFTVEFTSNRQLVCILKQDGGRKLSRLVTAQSADDTVIKGIMIDGDTQIDISATHKLAGSSLPVREPTGYVFHIG
ncbi:hypothetical protein GTO10_04790, partial [Candidatus Saccharibacteria bacterium]|nr:hypothetical protein [Candidatus Latescibacterota bacterium]NIT04208.1 hypothetical protein [Candidatus Saccharibacteria bacterium]